MMDWLLTALQAADVAGSRYPRFNLLVRGHTITLIGRLLPDDGGQRHDNDNGGGAC